MFHPKFFVIFLLLLFCAGVECQTSGMQTGDSKVVRAPEPTFFLKVDKKSPVGITLKSKNTTVTEITNALAKQYNMVFALSRAVAGYKPDIDLKASSLETVLQKLAPFVVLEKELAGGKKNSEVKGAYLYAYNESMPFMPNNTGFRENQVLVFEGNTETKPNEKEKSDVDVEYLNNKLSVRCVRQPVELVVGKIAEAFDLPFSVRGNVAETISLNVKDKSLEEVFAFLPRSAKLKFRYVVAAKQPIYMEFLLEGKGGSGK